MPDHNTRQSTLDRMEEAIAKLAQAQANLTQDHATLAQTQTSMTTKMDSMLEHLATITVQPFPLQPPPSHHPTPSSPNTKTHMKLDVPRFDGHDPIG